MAMPESSTSAPSSAPRVRVVVVDDVEDMRTLLRLEFDTDGRFEVVGEGEDGHQAIELAQALEPDLMVLDRQMPRLGGVEAIPEIRRRSPRTAVVLYTAAADAGTHQAALAAGALEVLEKVGGTSFVDSLASAVLDRAASPEATLEVRVGPVPAAAARTWIANTRTILDAVQAHPDVLPEPVPEDVLELFCSFLDQWSDIAQRTTEFRWVARAKPADVSRIVEQWATIDSMSDGDLGRLGVHWSPPDGEPFFEALTAGVLRALERHEETERLGRLLAEQWGQYQQRPHDHDPHGD